MTLFGGLLALAVACCLGARPADAQMEQHLGPLASLPELGFDGTWEMADENGWFRMSNTTDPGAITYFWYGADQVVAAPFRVALNVAIRGVGDDPSDAGILFNYRAGDQYLAYTIGNDNSVNVFIRTPDGLDVQTLPDVSAKGDGTDLLSVMIDGTDASLELNGTFLFKVQGSQPMSPNIGILASGSAHVGVTNLALTPAK